MAEPSSTTAASVAGAASHSWWLSPVFLQLAAMFGGGMIGAACVALARPPRSRRDLFVRLFVSGMIAMMCGRTASEWICHNVAWYNLHNMSWEDAVWLAMPVYLGIGGIAWAVVSVIAQFSEIMQIYGANKLADKIGIKRRK